jgi:hypothetical protein
MCLSGLKIRLSVEHCTRFFSSGSINKSCFDRGAGGAVKKRRKVRLINSRYFSSTYHLVRQCRPPSAWVLPDIIILVCSQ